MNVIDKIKESDDVKDEEEGKVDAKVEQMPTLQVSVVDRMEAISVFGGK
jgi:hypothetical protein